jgi:hypothetical protein
LPDDMYQRAQGIASLQGRDVADVLAETIACSLSPIATTHIEFYTDRAPQSEFPEKPSKIVMGRIVSTEVSPSIVLES